jgi:hypothetical protein
MGRRCCGAYGTRTYALALISAHLTVLLYLLLSHSTPGKIICRACMTADGEQIYCYARAAEYSPDVVRAGLEEAIVISRCEHTSVGIHSILTPVQMSYIFPPLVVDQSAGLVQRQRGRERQRSADRSSTGRSGHGVYRHGAVLAPTWSLHNRVD